MNDDRPRRLWGIEWLGEAEHVVENVGLACYYTAMYAEGDAVVGDEFEVAVVHPHLGVAGIS